MATKETSFSAEIHQLPARKLLARLLRILPPATRAELVGGSALILISLLAAAWACRCRSDALALERDSVMVEGKVLRLWVTSANNGQHYRVAYEYPAAREVAAPLLEGRDELPEKDFTRLAVGGPVAIKVCQTDPANHLVDGARPRAFSNPLALPFVLGVLSIITLAGIINVAWWWMCRGLRDGGMVFILRSKKTASINPS